jgi:hypothetical protein
MHQPDYQALFARLRPLLALALMVLVLSLLSDRFLTRGQRLEYPAPDLGEPLPLDRHDARDSERRHRPLRRRHPRPRRRGRAGLLKHGTAVPGTDLSLEFTPSGAILAGIAVGGAAGGERPRITRFRLPPFVATLGMLSIARGLTMLWTGGFPVTGLGDSFGHLGTGVFLGMPVPVWIMLALTAVFVVVTRAPRSAATSTPSAATNAPPASPASTSPASSSPSTPSPARSRGWPASSSPRASTPPSPTPVSAMNSTPSPPSSSAAPRSPAVAAPSPAPCSAASSSASSTTVSSSSTCRRSGSKSSRAASS